jgi:ankyrin repeat protein
MNNKDKRSGLKWIAKKGHLEILKFLVEKCSINVINPEMLLLSAENGHLEMVKFLVEQGNDINACSWDLLRNSAWMCHLEVVKFLVEQGLDLTKAKGVIDLLSNKKSCAEVSNYIQRKLSFF